MTFKNLVQPYQEQNWPIPVDFFQQNIWTSIVGMLFQGLICCGKMMSFEKTVYKKYIYICCIYKRLTLWKTHIIPARIYPLELRTYNLYIYPNSLRVNNSSDKPWNGLPRKWTNLDAFWGNFLRWFERTKKMVDFLLPTFDHPLRLVVWFGGIPRMDLFFHLCNK